MEKSKIIVIEGAQGVGKTTITDYLRHTIPYTDLYRLAGISDSTPTGREKNQKRYNDLLEYMKKLENQSINLLFDRTFFSEEIYGRLGFKQYKFTDIYEDLLDRLSKLDFDIYYITLYLEDENLFSERLIREGKGTTAYAKYTEQSSINQQREYLKMSEEVERKYSNIHVFRVENGRNLDETKVELKRILGIET